MKNNSVTVLGAGFVGVCTAISLIKRGQEVVLVDRLPPASETSHGNSGVICDMGFHPLADPELIPDFPKLILNRDPRFLIQYGELPGLAPWLAKFAGNCRRPAFQYCTEVMASISADAFGRHQDLMQASGSTNLLNQTGWIRAYRSRSRFNKACQRTADFDRHGISYKLIDAKGIRELEPGLGFKYPAAIWMDQTHTVTNPGLLCQSYFDYFISLGGEFVQREARAIELTQNGWKVTTGQQEIESAKLVMSFGAWSNELLKPLGIRYPYIMERGYHMMFEPPEDRVLTRSIIDVDKGYVLSPLQTGIRVTTGANPVARERPPNPRQLAKLMPHIRQTYPIGKPLLDKPWMGRRVSTPDSLPIIGPAVGRPGLFINTGQCHLGLTLAPVSGELVADEVCGQPDPLCKPFYPSRF